MCVFLSGMSTLVLSLYKYKTTQQFSGCAELWTLASAAAASCTKKVKQWHQCYSVTNRGGPTGPQGTANAGNFYIWKKSLNLHKITRTPWITAGLHNHALFVFFIKSFSGAREVHLGKSCEFGPYYRPNTVWQSLGGNFSQAFGRQSSAHDSLWTLSLSTEVKEQHNWILKSKHVNKEV